MIVPKLLNFKQKQCRMDIAQNMLTTFNDDPDLPRKVITGHETWVYDYDIEAKVQTSQWKCPEEPRPKKENNDAKAVHDNKKRVSEVFQGLEKTLV